jgi:phage gp29-like protein
MMTTTSAFGLSNVRNNLINPVQPPVNTVSNEQILAEQVNNQTKKLEMLQNAITDLKDKKITQEQFNTIAESLK